LSEDWVDLLFAPDRFADGSSPPYCGPPPTPDILSSAWNLDPWLIAGFLSLAISYLWLSARRSAPHRDKAFWTAMALCVAAFISPLCALSTALFSARVAHHILIIAFATPLLVYAYQPVLASLRRLPLSATFAAHTALFWLWHAPAPYAFALSSDSVYWIMQATLFLSAAAFWAALLKPETSPASAVGACFGSILQMGMLGALFTFAGAPLQAPHALTTYAFGLTPLEDQQLAGLTMWVPANASYIAFALYRLWRMFEPGRRFMGGKA